MSRNNNSYTDKYSDNYDPMKEDFEDNFYNPAVKYSRNTKDSGNIRLHIANIPPGIDETGLLNIFRNANFNALNPYIGKQDPNNPRKTSWGFLELKSLSEVQMAMNTLHKQPPHFLHVSFARAGPKEKNERNDILRRDYDCDAVSTASSSTMQSRGRGMVPPMEGKPPSRYPSKVPLEEPFFGDSSSTNHSNKNFMLPTDLYDVEASNAVNSSVESFSLDGRRRLVMGRGTFIPPDSTSVVQTTRVPDELRDIPDEELDRRMSLYISREYRRLQDTSEVEVSFDLDETMNIVFKLGQCVSCFRPSLYVCARCKAWYCSKYCRHIDLKDHLKKCIPRKVVEFNKDGTLRLVEVDQFADAIEKVNNLALKESLPTNENMSNQRKSFSSDRNDSMTNRKSNYLSQYSPSQSNPSGFTDSQSDRNSQEHYSNGKDNSFDEEKRDQRKNRESGPPRGGGYGNKGKGSNNRSGSDRDSGDRGEGPKDHGSGFNRRGGGGAPRGNQQKSGGNDKFADINSGPENSSNEARRKTKDNPFEAIVQTSIKNNIQNGVYKPGRDSNRSTQQDANSNQPNPPIPFNQFTEVTVSALANENLQFWAYSKSLFIQQSEIMEELGKHSATSKPFNCNLLPGLKVSAPYCGDWYRAEVKSVSGDEVKIFFIDFGNEASVKLKEVLPLPLNLAAIPPLAHQYVLAKNPKNPTISEDTILKIKPIKMVGDVWVAHAEGVTYVDQREEVTITVVTENDGEYWVRNVEDDELFEELTTNLGEHSTIKINTSLDEIYAYCLNQKWLRAKVVNRTPLTIFFIDRGFSMKHIKKDDLHPIPYRYCTLRPLAYKIKVTEESYNAFSSDLKKRQKIFIKTIEKTNEAVICKVVGISEFSSLPRHSSSLGKGPEIKSSHLLDNISEYKISQLHIERQMNDELLTGSLIPQGELQTFIKISSMVAKNIKKKDSIKLAEGMLVAAKWEDVWHRGRVILMRGKDPLVALLDRGRVVTPEEVSVLPHISYVPESAVKIVLKNPTSKSIKAGTILQLREINMISDVVQTDIEDLGEALILPWEPSVEDTGLRVIHIPPGTKVIISSFSSPKTVYLQSMHPDDVVSRAELLQDVATETLLSSPLNRKPYAGELLAARYTDNLYYRAQIFKKQGERYKVIFVDFGNVDLVKISDMKPLSTSLKTIPCQAIKVGLRGLKDEPFNNKCIHYLNDLTGIETQFTLDYDGDLNEVTLDILNGENLNSTLLDFMTPSWQKKNFDLAVSEFFNELDLDYEKWKKGEKFDIIVPKVVKHNSIAVLRIESKLLTHIESTLTPNITKYCESFDSTYTYVPRPKEICLAFFEDDGNWYRAICRKLYQQNSSEVFYLDYGNSGVVLHKNIRKMVSDFMSTPVALKICKIYGLPEKVSGDTKKRLLEYFNDFKGEAVVVEETPEETILWIPALETLATALGFEIKPPQI